MAPSGQRGEPKAGSGCPQGRYGEGIGGRRREGVPPGQTLTLRTWRPSEGCGRGSPLAGWEGQPRGPKGAPGPAGWLGERGYRSPRPPGRASRMRWGGAPCSAGGGSPPGDQGGQQGSCVTGSWGLPSAPWTGGQPLWPLPVVAQESLGSSLPVPSIALTAQTVTVKAIKTARDRKRETQGRRASGRALPSAGMSKWPIPTPALGWS